MAHKTEDTYQMVHEVDDMLDDIRSNTDSLHQEMDKLSSNIKVMDNISEKVKHNFSSLSSNVFANGIRSLVDGQMSRVVQGITRSSNTMSHHFEKQLWSKAVGNLLPSFGSGMQGLISQSLTNIISGFRAKGGPVSSGQTYVVGEKGPELFVPGTSGTVVPGGASSPVNITMNINTMDAGSFAKNHNQILAEMNLALSRSLRNL